MSPLAVVAAGPYNLFYSLAVAAAAASMFLAGWRRGWSAGAWAMSVAAWAAAGMIGAMLPHVMFGDAVAYRTIVGAVIVSTVALGLAARAMGRATSEVLDTTAVAIPFGAAIVRVGCFLAGCCQGIATAVVSRTSLVARPIACAASPSATVEKITAPTIVRYATASPKIA